MAEELEYDVTVGEGKYRLTYATGSMKIKTYRHGEPWPAGDELQGSGVVLALVQEVDELQSKLAGYTTGVDVVKLAACPFPSGDRRYPPHHPLSPEKVIAAYRSGQAIPKKRT